MSESESNNVTLEFCDGESVEINLNVDGVEEAPVNNTLYGRRNKEWVSVTLGGGIPDAPVDGLPYVRKDANWEEGYTKTDADAAFEPIGTTATHESRQDNPHNVDAAQVGADPAGSAAGVQSNLDTHTSDSDIHFSDAPSDGNQYARQDAGWEVVVGGGGGIPEAPNDSNSYVRAGLGWVVGYSKVDADAAFEPIGTTATHEARQDNPHNVTALQAGADPAGSAAAVQSNLDTHEANLSNPHNVTAFQAGADPVGSADNVQSNLDTHTGDSDIHFSDAPIDGKQYTRKDAAWEEAEAASGGGVMLFDLLSTGWVADGDGFYQDISHNLGTNDFLIEFEDAADNSIVIPNNVTKTDTNTVRVSVYGNTWDLRVLISTAPTPSNTGNGFIDYNNTDNPTALASNTWQTLPNDGLGAFSNSTYAPVGVASLIDTSDGSIDVSELDLGDVILIRNDFSITPDTNNALLEFRYQLGTGGAIYTLETVMGRLDDGSGKPYRFSLKPDLIYMGDTNTRDNPITLQIRLSTSGSVSNAGSVVTVIKR